MDRFADKRGFPRPSDNGGEGPSYRSCLAWLAVLAVLVWAAYSKTLDAPFYFDDLTDIVGNPEIRALSNFWPPGGARYIVFLSFAVNYAVGGLGLYGFHLVNIALHVSNSFIVFLLVEATFRTPAGQRGGRGGMREAPSLSYAAAAVSSAVFALHPVQTQAVTYICQRFTTLAAFFYLLSVLLYAKWRLGREEGKGTRAVFYYAAALFSAFVSQFTKEITFTLPIAIVLYDMTFFNGLKGVKERFVSLVPFLLLLLIIPLSFALPFASQDGGGETIEGILKANQRYDLFNRSSYQYLVTEFRVIVTYLRLLIAPVNQTFLYDYPRFTSIAVPEVLLSFLFLSSLAAGSVYLHIRSRKTGNFLTLAASFGVLWFFLTISVESSVIPIWDVIFEHRLYLPSIGIFLAFTSLIFHLWRSAGGRQGGAKRLWKITAALILLTGLPLGAASYMRNRLWVDKTALYEDMAEKSRSLPRVHMLLGNHYKDAGRYEDAAREYGKTIKINPDNAEAHNNIGTVYFNTGRYMEGIAAFKKALELRPAAPGIHYNLGLSYDRVGMTGEAARHYRETISLQPDFVDARYNLALDYARMGMRRDAVEEFDKFVIMAPPEDSGRIEEARRLSETLKSSR